MPPLHPMIVHFPIALFVVAVLFDGITWFTKKNTLAAATRILMILSVAGTLAAIISGEMLKSARGSYLPHGLLNLHQTLAITFGVYAVLLCILRTRSSWRASTGYMTLGCLGVILLAAVGHTGGTMAWPAIPKTAAAPPSTAISIHRGAGSEARSPVHTHPTHHTTSTHVSSIRHNTATHTAPNTSNGSGTHRSSSTPGPALFQVGSNSAQVTLLQQALNAVGVFHHSFTTYYGSVTEEAVKAFQQESGFPVTGAVDQQTLTALEKASGVSISTQGGSQTGSAAGSGSGSGSSGGASGGAGSGGSGSAGGSAGAGSTSAGSAGEAAGSGSAGGSSAANPAPSAPAAPAQPAVDQARMQAGYQAFVNACQSCHSLSTATQYEGSYSSAQWSDVVARMQSYAGGGIADTQDIIYYLSHANGGN